MRFLTARSTIFIRENANPILKAQWTISSNKNSNLILKFQPSIFNDKPHYQSWPWKLADKNFIVETWLKFLSMKLQTNFESSNNDFHLLKREFDVKSCVSNLIHKSSNLIVKNWPTNKISLFIMKTQTKTPNNNSTNFIAKTWSKT